MEEGKQQLTFIRKSQLFQENQRFYQDIQSTLKYSKEFSMKSNIHVNKCQ